ncbi:MAG TPA: MaoC/PaaZ C-terminal domain-containing protein [Paraburkholderia sp.]|jgi:acyl dehydratase
MSETKAIPELIEFEADPVRALDLTLYAVASGDHNPLHLDEQVARAAGFDKPLVHGMLSMAYAARLFTNRFGPGAVRSISSRFVGVAKRGDRLRFSARLLGRESATARYEVSAHTQDGGEVLVGMAEVALPASS